MKLVALVLLVLGAQASADPLLRHQNPELVRADLRSLTSRVYEDKAGKLVETGRSVRTYDATGHVLRDETQKPDGSMIVVYDYVWDKQGHLATRTYRDHTKRTETRTFTHKLDAKGRIVETSMRDPAAPAGEYFRDDITWRADGGRDVVTYRHYAKEGPYRSNTTSFDAKDRMERECYEHGGCSMIEYDAHGGTSRIRQQTKEEHYYLVYENLYDAAGHLAQQTVGNTETHYTWNKRGDVTEALAKRIASQGGAVQSKTIYTYDYR